MTEENRTVADEVDDEEIQKIKEDFKGEPDTVKLRINRVPKYVSDDLKELADEKFAGDYGMALTYYHQMYQQHETFLNVVNDLTARVARLESRVQDLINGEDEVDDEGDEGLQTLN